jgi:integrase
VDERGRKHRSRRWSSGTLDYQEAVREAQRAEDRLNAGSGLLREYNVESVVNAYIAGNRLSESFETNCTSALKAAPGFAKLSLAKVDRATVLLARDEMRPGRANSTVNGYVRALRAAWNWADDRDMVPHSWPGLKEELDAETTKRPYEPEEVATTLEWLRENPRGFVDWHAFHTLQADTGVRPGELVRLKGEHIDRTGCRIWLSRNKSGRQGKERREEWIRVPRETMDLLPDRKPEEWLWPSRGVQARGHVTVNGARLALQRALKACGLRWRGKLDQYSFRRYWIDSADAEGVVLGDAMKQAGHRKAETHVGYRRNSTRAVPQATVESVRKRRLRGAAPQSAPQERAGQPRKPMAYMASSDCSR